MKEIKIEWCENWIKAKFAKHPFPGGGFEINCFFDMAERAGLWERGTYGSPMSKAILKLCRVETVRSDDGKHLYDTFKLR